MVKESSISFFLYVDIWLSQHNFLKIIPLVLAVKIMHVLITALFTSLLRKISKMFQIPVENLDNIRKVRKKVKSILVDIGLDCCKELLKVRGCSRSREDSNTREAGIGLWR